MPRRECSACLEVEALGFFVLEEGLDRLRRRMKGEAGSNVEALLGARRDVVQQLLKLVLGDVVVAVLVVPLEPEPRDLFPVSAKDHGERGGKLGEADVAVVGLVAPREDVVQQVMARQAKRCSKKTSSTGTCERSSASPVLP